VSVPLFVTGQRTPIEEAAVSLKSRGHASFFPVNGGRRLLQGDPGAVFLGACAAGRRYGAAVAQLLIRSQLAEMA
jgi:hypothetical protein